MKLLSVDPAIYGRDEAGHSSVSSTNQPQTPGMRALPRPDA